MKNLRCNLIDHRKINIISKSVYRALMLGVLIPIYADSKQDRKPNIILADGVFWYGTSVGMQPGSPQSTTQWRNTPVLSSLAQQGMIFSQAL